MMISTGRYLRAIPAALILYGVIGGAAEFEKIDPLPVPESGVGGGYETVEAMVADFERKDSSAGYFAAVPKGIEGTEHFLLAQKHEVTVPYRDAKVAVVFASGENVRQGYCAVFYLVSLGMEPGSSIGCQVVDCIRRVGVGYSVMVKTEFVKLPQFPKPLLHIAYYRGGRRVGDYLDEWFRIDRGKLEPVLAIRTGRWIHAGGFLQESEFHADGDKLIATTNRSSESPEGTDHKEKFETTFTWDEAKGTFAAKDSTKLELRDRDTRAAE